MEKNMENNTLVKNLENRFTVYFNVLEDIVEMCPNELWNKKCSEYIFWQQLVHTFSTAYLWLRDEEINFLDGIDDGINGLNIKTELDVEHKDALKESYTKTDVLKICNGAKNNCEKWFDGKNDEWLFFPSKMHEKFTNFDVTIIVIEHIMYHVGHCEAIFRENNIKTRKYLDY
jgi:hypothetical protein